eukprot:s794_g12.t1
MRLLPTALRRHALALAWAGSALADGTRPCGLAAMQLRSTDHAVDLQPRFSPEEFSYSATLDFSMETFSIDAEPEAGCEVGGLPNRPFLAPAVEKGSNPKESNICARDPATGAEQWYRISVAKLSGAETEIAGMRVRGGELVPGFRPQQRLYQVQLDVSHDFVEVDFVLQDNGQKVLWKATPEVPRQGLNSQGSIVRALVMETGEQQHHQRHEVFPLDVGFSRQLSLHIESADPLKAAQGVYTINVTRGGCSKQRPLYNPQTPFKLRASPACRAVAILNVRRACTRTRKPADVHIATGTVLSAEASPSATCASRTRSTPLMSLTRATALAQRSGAASSRSTTGGACPDRSSAGSSCAGVWSLFVSGCAEPAALQDESFNSTQTLTSTDAGPKCPSAARPRREERSSIAWQAVKDHSRLVSRIGEKDFSARGPFQPQWRYACIGGKRFLRARQEFAEFDVEGLPAPDDPWYWPGWDGPAHDRPPRSSRPSSARARQSKPAGVGRAAEPAFVGDEVLGNRQEAESRPVDHNDFRNGTTGQATSQMADCVKGVLSRINEALTKLDQPQDWEPVMPGIGTPGTARAQQAEVQSAEAFASARPGPGPGSRLSARGQAGAKSPVLVTPRAFLGKFQDGAPRDGHWRVVDSWA